MGTKNKSFNKSTFVILIIVIITIGIGAIAYLSFIKSEERIKNRTVKVEIQSDGKAIVEDEWDVNIVDSSTLYISFDDAVKENFSNIMVSRYNENLNRWEDLMYNSIIAKNGREELNRFHAGNFQGKFEIAWGVDLKGSKDRRKYKVRYEVKGPLTKYLDTAEYYHMLVGKSFEMPIENFYALVSFPEPVNESTTSIWGHGAPSGEIHFVDGKIEIKAKDIPKNTFVEGRALLPTSMFPYAQTVNSYRAESVLREEQLNKERTYVAKINNQNKEMYFKIGIASIAVIVFLVIIYEIGQNNKIKSEFPEAFVKEWERYTGLPQTKLDILAANVVYEDKGSKEFLVTVLMKLAHKKYIEIIEIKDKIDNINTEYNPNILDEALSKKIKIIEKYANDSGVMVNPIELANIYAYAENKHLKRIASDLHLKEKDLNNIRYKVNLNKINDARTNNQLDKDESFIINFLVKLSEKRLMSVAQFEENIKEGIKKNKSSIPFEVFFNARQLFDNEIEVNEGILYIEQYQIVNEIVKHSLEYDKNYAKNINARKVEAETEGIYSEAKNKKASEIIGKTFFEIILIALSTFGLFRLLVGNIQFNEDKYIIGVILAIISFIIILILAALKYKRIVPPLTEKGLNIKAEYQGLFNFLNNDSFIKEYPEESVIIWGEFLVLATYFGIASKVLKTLKSVHPEVTQALGDTNYSMLNTYATWGMLNTINTSSRNIAIATAASTAGSAISSGGGGGFSAGGGGGFGGGGGGSR